MIIEVLLDPREVAIESPGRCLFYRPALSVIDWRGPDTIAEKWVELICLCAAQDQDHALPDTFPLKPLLRSLCDPPTKAMMELRRNGYATTAQVYGYLMTTKSAAIEAAMNGRYSLTRYPWGDDAYTRYYAVRVDTGEEAVPETFGMSGNYHRQNPGTGQGTGQQLPDEFGIGESIEPEDRVTGPLWRLANIPSWLPSLSSLQDASLVKPRADHILVLDDFSRMEEVPQPLQECPWSHGSVRN